MTSFQTPRTSANALPPHLMSPEERRQDLCQFLSLGLVRLISRQSSKQSTQTGESSLHFTRFESGHATPTQKETA